LEKKLPSNARLTDYFDLIVGTSTGGIIALGLGAGLTASEILSFYIERGKNVFSGHFWKWGVFSPKYSFNILRENLNEVLGNTKLKDSKTALCIPSYEGKFGEVYIFKTPHHPRFFLDKNESITNIALATSAAPANFKPFIKGGYIHVDGGLFANNPIMVGIVDALTNFQLKANQVKVLSIGCESDKTPLRRRHLNFSGKISWRDSIFISLSLQSQNALGQAKLLVGPNNIFRLYPETREKIELDDYDRALKTLPKRAELDFSKSWRVLEKNFFQRVKVGCKFYLK